MVRLVSLDKSHASVHRKPSAQSRAKPLVNRFRAQQWLVFPPARRPIVFFFDVRDTPRFKSLLGIHEPTVKRLVLAPGNRRRCAAVFCSELSLLSK